MGGPEEEAAAGVGGMARVTDGVFVKVGFCLADDAVGSTLLNPLILFFVQAARLSKDSSTLSITSMVSPESTASAFLTSLLTLLLTLAFSM